MEERKIKQINAFLSEIQQKVDPVIERILLSGVAKPFQPLAKHQIATGGKRLRPALAVAACRLLGGKENDVLQASAGLEILHNYTLIIDDIIDNGLFRRNKPTTWAKYGKSIAECAAVDYAAAIFQAANYAPKNKAASELLALTLKTLVEGEILDILFDRQGHCEEPYIVKNRFKSVSDEKYLEMVAKKTAALIQASCELGGLCSGASAKEITALRGFGLNLGIAFQLQDDILDIFAEEKELGKKIGKDIEEKKGGNVVLMLAFREFSQKNRTAANHIMRQEKISSADVKKVIGLIGKTKAKEESIQRARKYVKTAKGFLQSLPKNKWNELLSDVADFVVERVK
ncbi:MAG: polyprenyl synthetase family protein [Patescibacteria group bacterium]|nr:polyprenyl synthetase family protein [Patescibacteria group bacterium]